MLNGFQPSKTVFTIFFHFILSVYTKFWFSYAEAPGEEPASLLCSQCKDSFQSAWDLMVHVQQAHLINIYQLGSDSNSNDGDHVSLISLHRIQVLLTSQKFYRVNAVRYFKMKQPETLLSFFACQGTHKYIPFLYTYCSFYDVWTHCQDNS